MNLYVYTYKLTLRYKVIIHIWESCYKSSHKLLLVYLQGFSLETQDPDDLCRDEIHIARIGRRDKSIRAMHAEHS